MDISNLENISDGVKDGFALFYIKDGILCMVGLTQEQAKIFNLTLKTVFSNEPAKVQKSKYTVTFKQIIESEGDV